MQAVERALISFFEQVARRDAAQLTKLSREPCFTLEQDRWCFALPDLFSFLQREDGAFGGIGYKRFRQLLFDSPVNQTARRFGAEIIIVDNRSKVDQSRYALVWQSGESPGS